MIRKTPNKPLRVYLQDGSGDLDNEHGKWPLANQEMAAALKFKGYITSSSMARAVTTTSTAAPFCPMPCAGCGAT